MDKKRPTNADLYQKLGTIQEIAEATRIQAAKTNGRVTSLEKWQNEVTAVATYQDKHSDKGSDKDYIKVILYALGLVGTALGVIGVVVSR